MMLDKSDVKSVEDVSAEKTKEPEPTKTVAVKEAVEAVEAVETAEIVVKAREPETTETVEAKETVEIVKAEPKKTGYLSEIDGVEVDFELQYREHETDMKDIAKRVTEDYAKRGNDASKIELIQVYLKPTDFTAYYVINNSYEGKIPLF